MSGNILCVPNTVAVNVMPDAQFGFNALVCNDVE